MPTITTKAPGLSSNISFIVFIIYLITIILVFDKSRDAKNQHGNQYHYYSRRRWIKEKHDAVSNKDTQTKTANKIKINNFHFSAGLFVVFLISILKLQDGANAATARMRIKRINR